MHFQTVLVFFGGPLQLDEFVTWVFKKGLRRFLVDVEVSKGCGPLMTSSQADSLKWQTMAGPQEDYPRIL